MQPESAQIPEVFAILLGGFFLIGLPLLFLGFWVVLPMWLDKRHLRSLGEREAASAGLPVVPSRTLASGRTSRETRMVTASVVMSLNYFRRFLSKFRFIIGGRLKNHERLMERARREVVLRLKEQCPGADIIVNLRFETSTISSGQRDEGVAAVEVLAVGTAIWYTE